MRAGERGGKEPLGRGRKKTEGDGESEKLRYERASEVGREFISPVSHLKPSAARLKFHLGRADVIKTNYAYGTVMLHHFIP